MHKHLQKKIMLGLDLQGGMHLVLQVHTEDALRAETDGDMARLAPLDAAPVAQQDAPAPASSSALVATAESKPAPAPETHADDQQPLLASMAMFPPLDHSAAKAPLASAAAPSPAAEAARAVLGRNSSPPST